MGERNYKEIFDRKKEYEKQILKLCPNARSQSGIYIMTREENGFRYGYCGQSISILSRLVSHMEGNEQHIDKSIKAHKLYSEQNPCGWKIFCYYFPKEQLDEKELYYTRLLANKGYQMRNKTGGSQGVGKFGINGNKLGKGYYDGIKRGEIKSRRLIAHLFDKHLDCVYKGNREPTKNQLKAMAKFQEFITIEKEEKEEKEK